MLYYRTRLAALALVLAAAGAACAPSATDNRTAPQATTPAPTETVTVPTNSPAPETTATPVALAPTTTSAVDNSRTTAVAAGLQTLVFTRAAETRVATAAPTLGAVSTVGSGVDNSQTTAVAGMLQAVAQTRAAQIIAPTAPPTRSSGVANATLSVAAIATAYGPAAAAAAEGVSLGTVITPPLMLRDFSLPVSTGGEMNFHGLDGKFRMLFFGYLHCPDFCPLTMAEFRQVKALLGDLADEVEFIYISVDGARDTPELIANYLDNFDPAFIGFSGDDTTLARIQPDYGFYYQRRLDTGSQAEYVIDHSTRSYLIDRAGRLRSSFTYDTEPEIIANALRWYLRNE